MQRIRIHPDNPQPRLIQQVVGLLEQGQLLIYPTDTAYALGCRIGDKAALERIARLRQLDERHQFALLCRDLSEIATYAKVDNQTYRLLKAHTPARCTFILEATSEVPRRLAHPRKKTIGIRIPTDTVCQALLTALGQPLITSTLQLPDEPLPMDDPELIAEQLGRQVDVLLDAGILSTQVTTIIDMTTAPPQLIRQGAEQVDDWLA